MTSGLRMLIAYHKHAYIRNQRATENLQRKLDATTGISRREQIKKSISARISDAEMHDRFVSILREANRNANENSRSC